MPAGKEVMKKAPLVILKTKRLLRDKQKTTSCTCVFLCFLSALKLRNYEEKFLILPKISFLRSFRLQHMLHIDLLKLIKFCICVFDPKFLSC
jgi:hypothetical protein